MKNLIPLENGCVAGLKTDYGNKEEFVKAINKAENNENGLTVGDIKEGRIDYIKKEFIDEFGSDIRVRTSIIDYDQWVLKIDRTEYCYVFIA
jgi:hypothetical protein